MGELLINKQPVPPCRCSQPNQPRHWSVLDMEIVLGRLLGSADSIEIRCRCNCEPHHFLIKP